MQFTALSATDEDTADKSVKQTGFFFPVMRALVVHDTYCSNLLVI